jgi:hypothetical protein
MVAPEQKHDLVWRRKDKKARTRKRNVNKFGIVEQRDR